MPLALILIGWASWTNPTHQSPTYLHSKVTHPKAQKPIKKKEKKKKNSCVKLTPLYLYIIQKTQRSNGPNHFWAHHETLEQAPWHTWVSFFHYINYSLLPLRLRDRSLNSQIQSTEFRETESNKANPPKKNDMSDSEEHHFESKADAGASKTYPQQAGTIRKNGYIVIKNRPCKVQSFLLCFYDKIYFWFWVFFVFLA